MVHYLSLWDVDHSTTLVCPSVGSSDAIEDEISGLSIYSRITASTSGYFPAIRSNPCDGGWSEEILHWVSGAGKGHDLPTTIVRGGVT